MFGHFWSCKVFFSANKEGIVAQSLGYLLSMGGSKEVCVHKSAFNQQYPSLFSKDRFVTEPLSI